MVLATQIGRMDRARRGDVNPVEAHFFLIFLIRLD